ncbi:hypothetical protein BJ944DRAFT_251803 [Cunninghamella echinulata]|nr:hypothetical protein BJ944DRAFT_251803 [Cunninghamella echinulata]
MRMYHNNLDNVNQGVNRDYGRCITGSKNSEEVIKIEDKNDPYFKCRPEATSANSELIACEQLRLPENTCNLCSFLKDRCDNTYCGKWTLDFGSELVCVKC